MRISGCDNGNLHGGAVLVACWPVTLPCCCATPCSVLCCWAWVHARCRSRRAHHRSKGGWCLAMMPPPMAEPSYWLEWSEHSLATVGCDRSRRSLHTMPSRRGEVGAPLSSWRCVELLNGVPYHDPQWGRWPAVGWAREAVYESFLRGERLRPPKQLAMNSRLPKWTVSPREKPLHIKRSPSAETASVSEGTIRTSKEKALQHPLPGTPNVSVFSHWQDIGLSRSSILIQRWSCEQCST
jgi:hypothetical protein